MHSGKMVEEVRSVGEDEQDDLDGGESTETDLSDVGLCSLNIHEHTYNIALCHMQVYYLS